MKNTQKRGAKQKPYKTVSGQYINGLSKMADGRWRIIGTQTRFSEPDESKAVEKFHQLTNHIPADIAKDVASVEYTGSAFFGLMNGFVYAESAPTAEKKMWKWIGNEIRKNPKLRAEMTGIEELGYLNRLKATELLPSPAELLKVWQDHAKCDKEQKRKVIRAWEEFQLHTQITTIDQITPELCIAYQDDIHSRDLAGKQQQHLFSGAKRLLSFAKSRAIAVNELARILEYMKLMQPNESTKNLSPEPISVSDWKKLLSAAEGDDKAMVLLMLNAALYASEVIRLEYTDFQNNCLVTRRRKTGENVRVATLWPETIEAMKALKRNTNHLFISLQGLPLERCGAFARFNAITAKAGIPHVKPSHLRDGTYTTAVAAGISFPLCQLLTGHATGMSDNYVLASPEIVAPACQAVYNHYMKEPAKPVSI